MFHSVIRVDANLIKLLMLDVDGVLTDGRLFPESSDPAGDDGLTGKAFHVQDGCAIKLWQRLGGETGILSGRTSRWIDRRADELDIRWRLTGATDKGAAYETLRKQAGCADVAIAYVGDDLPDLRPMARCGLPIAVANAVPEVKRVAAYVTRGRGGDGVVAEVVEMLLRRQKRWRRDLFEAM